MQSTHSFLQGVDNMGGVSSRSCVSFAGAVVAAAAKLVETPNNFIKTASREGAETRGTFCGADRKKARRACSLSKSSWEGTVVTAAKDECMPVGGGVAWNVSLPHRVIVIPSKAPASSTDSGKSDSIGILQFRGERKMNAVKDTYRCTRSCVVASLF
jgi:hypothetical protein